LQEWGRAAPNLHANQASLWRVGDHLCVLTKQICGIWSNACTQSKFVACGGLSPHALKVCGMWRTLASLLARFHACTQSKFVACGGPWRVYYLDPSKVNKCEPPLKDRGHHGNCRHAPGEGSGGRRSGVQLLQVDMEETKGWCWQIGRFVWAVQVVCLCFPPMRMACCPILCTTGRKSKKKLKESRLCAHSGHGAKCRTLYMLTYDMMVCFARHVHKRDRTAAKRN